MPDNTGQMPETRKRKPRKLNKRQKEFVYEYATIGNAYEAAIKAGYSKGSAKNASVRMLENDAVKSEIDKLQQIKQKKLDEKFNITSEMILARLAKIAFSDLKDMIQPEDMENIKLIDSAGLKSIKVARGFDNITLTAHDTVKALQLLGEYIGLFGKKEVDDGDKSNNALVKERISELARKYKQTGSDK